MKRLLAVLMLCVMLAACAAPGEASSVAEPLARSPRPHVATTEAEPASSLPPTAFPSNIPTPVLPPFPVGPNPPKETVQGDLDFSSYVEAPKGYQFRFDSEGTNFVSGIFMAGKTGREKRMITPGDTYLGLNVLVVETYFGRYSDTMWNICYSEFSGLLLAKAYVSICDGRDDCDADTAFIAIHPDYEQYFPFPVGGQRDIWFDVDGENARRLAGMDYCDQMLCEVVFTWFSLTCWGTCSDRDITAEVVRITPL